MVCFHGLVQSVRGFALDACVLCAECQPQALHPYIIAAIVVGSILVIGIILIVLWKIIDEMRYRIEMAKFEEDRKKMKWSRVSIVCNEIAYPNASW